MFKLLLLSVLAASSAIKIPQKGPDPLKWWEEAFIYQVYPRSHMDSDGDGVGDLLGIQSKLDHLVDLGITAVWISPFYKSPMKDFGYDISNFTDIEPVFGNLSTFKSMSDAMKLRNIKLIMDFVPNHSSDEHPWFEQSVAKVHPYTDYYVWKDPIGYENGKPLPPNNWVSVFGGSAWEWREERQQFYLHQFVAGQPDLNYENPRVMTEMLAAAKFWLDQGVDGFRMDAVSHMFEDPLLRDEPEDPNRPEGSLPTEWLYYSHPYTYNLQPQVLDALYQFRQLLDIYTISDGKERSMMVEVTKLDLDDLFVFYGTEQRPVAHFPFNFEFINGITKNFTANDITALIDEWFDKMPQGRTPNWLVGNHDNHRVSARFGDYVIDHFNMIIHLLPGSSVTYYGEEIGMQNTWISWEDTVDPAGCNAGPDRYELFSRDPERTPMHWDNSVNSGFSTGDETWLPVNENYTWLNLEAQNEVPETHLEIYKKISQLRTSDVWKFGSLQTINRNSLNIFGYSRIYNQSGFLVLANFGSEQIVVDAQSQFEGIPATAKVFTRSQGFVPENILIGDILDTRAVTIGARHSLILDF